MVHHIVINRDQLSHAVGDIPMDRYSFLAIIDVYRRDKFACLDRIGRANAPFDFVWCHIKLEIDRTAYECG